MKLLRAEIRRNCDTSTYQRADGIYLRGKISDFRVDRSDNHVTLHGKVRGTGKEPYSCEVDLKLGSDDKLSIENSLCDCPSYSYYFGMCKHCAAICLNYCDQLKAEQTAVQPVSATTSSIQRSSDQELTDILQRYAAQEPEETTTVKPGSIHISMQFALDFTSIYYYGHVKQPQVEIKAGAERLYVIKSIPAYVHAVLHGTLFQYGKKLSVCHSQEMFDPISWEIFQILAQAVRERVPKIDTVCGYCDFSNGKERSLTLTSAHAAALLRLQREADGTISFNGTAYPCADCDPPVVLTIRQSNNGAMLVVTTMFQICPEPHGIYLMNNTIYFATAEFQQKALPFLNGIGALDENSQAIKKYLSEADFGRFCGYVLPKLKQVMTVEETDIDFTPFLPQTPEFCFYLSGTQEGQVCLRAEVSYREATVPLEVVGSEYRNLALETPVLRTVTALFPHAVSSELRTTDRDDEVYLLLTEGLDRLRELGTVMVDDTLHNLRFAANPTTTVGVALHGDLIDIQIDSVGYGVAEINAILDAYRIKRKYYRLKSGEFLSLTEGGLSVIADMADGIDLHFDQTGLAQTGAFRASYINSMLDRDDAGVDMHRNAAFKSQILALKNYRDEALELPEGLQATLRGYQKSGYRWLCALSSCSLGGILADDMGLGKTVQMLAYFLHLGGGFLVVCPASLIYNWASECKRFSPSIACHIMRGSEAERKQILDRPDGLTITSYDQLRRDIDFYQNKQFDCCVLDEAQYIRNAGTKAAKAVKQIHANHRFALTGTPIENRLSDLWSIFDFLMPGYLFTYQAFKTRIEQGAIAGDTAATQRLTTLTTPFILRRKKADVLKELPDKQETIVYVEMTDQQRTLYNAQEQALRLTLQKTTDAEYLHQKIEYLAALTRLRQICCTPELYIENYVGGSGKVDACMELLTEGAESGHRTLVFSQFTSMLELLIQRAEAAGLSFLYLSGKNTSEQRLDMVQKFQSGAYSVFFISLKAGGTGLNLTAADRVLHFDPWWNIAAEEQATDRTHRIGQKNMVLVTKLVCKDTVEERIVELQERKRSLSNLVMDQESVRSAVLDRAALLGLLEGTAEVLS